MKRLVVTADDFGLSPGVVEGVVEAHERGIVTSTSLLVNAPAAEAAFAEARRHARLACGLHLNLTFGRPVGPPAPLGGLLDESGRFRKNGSGAHENIEPAQVRAEIRAQLERFMDGAGRPPSHLDGHHHVHRCSGLLPVVIEEARRLAIPVRSTDGASRERLRREGIVTCDRFLDRFYAGGDPDAVREDRLLEILETLPEGTSELMCHPAREDSSLSEVTGYVAPRFAELRTLTSPEVRRAVARLGIELVPMGAGLLDNRRGGVDTGVR